MDNPFKNLKLDRWYDVLLVLSAIVFLYSLAFEVKFFNNEVVGFASLGVFFVSLAFMAMKTTGFRGDDGFFAVFSAHKLNFTGAALLIIAAALLFFAYLAL